MFTELGTENTEINTVSARLYCNPQYNVDTVCKFKEQKGNYLTLLGVREDFTG